MISSNRDSRLPLEYAPEDAVRIYMHRLLSIVACALAALVACALIVTVTVCGMATYVVAALCALGISLTAYWGLKRHTESRILDAAGVTRAQHQTQIVTPTEDVAKILPYTSGGSVERQRDDGLDILVHMLLAQIASGTDPEAALEMLCPSKAMSKEMYQALLSLLSAQGAGGEGEASALMALRALLAREKTPTD